MQWREIRHAEILRPGRRVTLFGRAKQGVIVAVEPGWIGVKWNHHGRGHYKADELLVEIESEAK